MREFCQRFLGGSSMQQSRRLMRTQQSDAQTIEPVLIRTDPFAKSPMKMPPESGSWSI